MITIDGVQVLTDLADLTADEAARYVAYVRANAKLGDDDILVKVEGCGICGTDSHEYKRDPFSLIPVALGHEGTGEIVKIGRNVTKDSAGNPIGVGDKLASTFVDLGNPPVLHQNVTVSYVNLWRDNVGVFNQQF